MRYKPAFLRSNHIKVSTNSSWAVPRQCVVRKITAVGLALFIVHGLLTRKEGVQGELIRAVVFPPAGIMILAQIQGDAEDIGKGEPVIEALVFAGFDVD